MALKHLTRLLLIGALINICNALSVRTMFEKCGGKGFTCALSKELPTKHDVTFQCNTSGHTGQDVTFHLWNFNSPISITSLTIQECETVRISFQCSAENKPMQVLKIKNAKYYEVIPAMYHHNPPKIILENISYIEKLPRDAFLQIKKVAYKPGCIVPVSDFNEIEFKNVRIGTIETEAFKDATDMKSFIWNNVSINRIHVNAIQLSFISGASGSIDKCNLNVFEPMSLRLSGEAFSITNSKIQDIWGSGINGTIYDFKFNNNTVTNMQSGAISILSQNVHVMNNHFINIETGAFQKIAPGLLHDSERNFGRLLFGYKFTNNLIEAVGDGGIRPDIVAYKNVAADVNFKHNTLQCSCEGLTWLGADVELGFGYSVIKDFNTIILDPLNSNMCTFTPCMCFGVRSPNKKHPGTGSNF